MPPLHSQHQSPRVRIAALRSQAVAHPVRRLFARAHVGPASDGLLDAGSVPAVEIVPAVALEWGRRVVTRPADGQFTIAVPLGAGAALPPGDRDGSICGVDDLWVGFPAPDGMRIGAATAMIGTEGGAPCLRLHFEVQGRFTEQRLSAGAMTSLLRQTLARVS